MMNNYTEEDLRKYLDEWKKEQEYASEHMHEPNFSWYWHDKELISIQGAIRAVYEHLDPNSLTDAENAQVKKILECVID